MQVVRYGAWTRRWRATLQGVATRECKRARRWRAARAQQASGMRRIAVLTTFSDSDALAPGWHAAFRKGLEESGWHHGRNLQIDYRWASGDADPLRALARELVLLQPDVKMPSVPWRESWEAASSCCRTPLRVHREQIVSLAARYRLPAVYPFRWFAETAACFHTASIPTICFVVLLPRSIAFSKARSRLIFRCKRQPNTKWSSISRRPGR